MEYSVMDDLFTETPWSWDIPGMLYAVNGHPGRTTVAKLLPGAPAEVLAAAPELLRALEEFSDRFDHGDVSVPMGGDVHFLAAVRQAEAAIASARRGPIQSAAHDRLWEADAALPTAERDANARLLDAAPQLFDAAKTIFGQLTSQGDQPELVGELRAAITRAYGG
jgi:hypothetical protein